MSSKCNECDDMTFNDAKGLVEVGITSSVMINKLILGTVQLGLPYGINNTSGQPTQEEANSLLATAFEKGIRCLDTAEAYGNSQETIGSYHRCAGSHQFSIITKYKGYQTFLTGADFVQHFLRNLVVLNVSSLDAYLFHNFDEYRTFNYWHELDVLRLKGMVKRIGVSVYTNEQAIEVAADERIEIVQLPFNMLDNLSQRGDILALLYQKGKEVHIRSVFLQGLFYKNRNDLNNLQPLKEYLLQLDGMARDCGVGIGALALAYCLRQPYIDKVLIGVETKAQLIENLDQASAAIHIDQNMLSEIDRIKVTIPQLLNPVNWS